jgi:hypothetical protein
MINAFLTSAREQVVADAMTAHLVQTPYLRIDTHTAASLLQKSIRRSQKDWALGAAQRLFDLQPRKLWRRLAVILFEDVGLLDRQLSLDLMAAAPRKGASPVPWSVVAYLVRRLCEVPKTQVANNLLHLSLYDLEEAATMEEFDFLVVGKACEWITDERHTLVQRAKAVWQLSGISCSGPIICHPGADLERVITILARMVTTPTLEVIAREGVRLTGHVLPLVSVMEAAVGELPGGIECVSDPTPPERLIAGVPSWVFDQYTWAGKSALRRAASDCPAISADLDTRAVTAGQRFRALADAHFEFESANLARRAQLAGHISFWRRVQALGPYRVPKTATKLYGALSKDWELFQMFRS